MGIGTGSLSSDVELFEVGGDTDRNDMVRESMQLIQAIWDGEPPYSIEGKYWNVNIEDMARSEFGVGHFVKPYQKSGPPVAISIMSPKSNSARIAAKMLGFQYLEQLFCTHAIHRVIGRSSDAGMKVRAQDEELIQISETRAALLLPLPTKKL